ncbi:PAS domain-containing protein [Streptomyces sp. NPDC048191]|uniref:PAS domain-containing protein n=1 Tax=Streptomyces sp. NPDC048191 TaxID=3155484 RepID=UPI0033F44C7A
MRHGAAVAIIDALGTVTGWSEGARRLTGHSAEDVVGRPAARLLAADPPDDVLAERTGTVALRHRDGHRVDAALTACPVTGADGRPTGFVVTADPPGTTLAAEAFEQASMSMSVFDLEQRYLRANDAACKVMGVPESALTGRFFADTVEEAEYNTGFLRHLREVAETGRPVRYESFAAAPALNREHLWSLEMWPLHTASGELTGVAMAAFDSSEQYWARRRLALLNEASTGIGTTLDVARTAEELIDVLVPRYADFASVNLLDWVLGGQEPPMIPDGGGVLHRIAHGSTHAGDPGAAVRVGETDFHPPHSPPARALREGRAVLSQAGEPDFTEWLAERNARSPQGRPYRQAAGERLTAWGLEEAAFVTELVVSELVTNAIRYGEPPIQLRLIRDRALICEVSDASSTAPHLRRAHAYDEGGRGLLLVAQLTQRWGSRQTGRGKTIWAEQALPASDHWREPPGFGASPGNGNPHGGT